MSSQCIGGCLEAERQPQSDTELRRNRIELVLVEAR